MKNVLRFTASVSDWQYCQINEQFEAETMGEIEDFIEEKEAFVKKHQHPLAIWVEESIYELDEDGELDEGSWYQGKTLREVYICPDGMYKQEMEYAEVSSPDCVKPDFEWIIV